MSYSFRRHYLLFLSIPFFGTAVPTAADPIVVTVLPGSVYASFVGENQGFCSGSFGANNGGTGCVKDTDIAFGELDPEFKVETTAQFGVFPPVGSNPSATATATASLPLEIDGRGGIGYFEMNIAKTLSPAVQGSYAISASGATLGQGSFSRGYDVFVAFTYGTPFTLTLQSQVTSTEASPFNSISVELASYRVLENVPCTNNNCVDIPLTLAPESPTFALATVALVGLLMLGAHRLRTV